MTFPIEEDVNNNFIYILSGDCDIQQLPDVSAILRRLSIPVMGDRGRLGRRHGFHRTHPAGGVFKYFKREGDIKTGESNHGQMLHPPICIGSFLQFIMFIVY